MKIVKAHGITSSLTLWLLCLTTERPLLPRPISSMSLLARLVFEMPGMSMAVSFIGGILGREGWQRSL